MLLVQPYPPPIPISFHLLYIIKYKFISTNSIFAFFLHNISHFGFEPFQLKNYSTQLKIKASLTKYEQRFNLQLTRNVFVIDSQHLFLRLMIFFC